MLGKTRQDILCRSDFRRRESRSIQFARKMNRHYAEQLFPQGTTMIMLVKPIIVSLTVIKASLCLTKENKRATDLTEFCVFFRFS